MRKMIFSAVVAFVVSTSALFAQSEVMAIAALPADSTASIVEDSTICKIQECRIFKIGTLNYDSLLQSLPAYHEVMRQFNALADSYKAEAVYNETNFKRKFTEYLQGQKDFPQNILLRRQKDLQKEMEKAMAFRTAADSLLQQAKQEMLAPVKARLNAAIHAVGMEREYREIVNTASHSHLFINPQFVEDTTPFVLQHLYGDGVKEETPNP